jgi:hypothetical protein
MGMQPWDYHSELTRSRLIRLAEEHRFSFTVKVPNVTTRKSITELESGNGKPLNSLNDLLDDLHTDS